MSDTNFSLSQSYSKTQGKWTAPEHAKFIEATKIWGRQWKHISGYVKSRSASQCRSHAQKHYIKLEMSRRMLKTSSIDIKVQVIELERPISNISHFQLETNGRSSQGAQYGEDIIFLID